MPIREDEAIRSMHVRGPELAQAVAGRLAELASGAQDRRGRFSIVLSGGSTPRALFALLAEPPWRDRFDWRRVRVYWADERCVPPEDAESNYRLAREAFLNAVRVPEEQVFRIRGELAPEEAAADYVRRLGEPWPRFDAVLLGLGGDGHTASIFPGSSWGEDDPAAVAVQADYGGRPSWRVTLTPAILGRARHVLFLVAGEGKAEALAGSLGTWDPERWPAQRVVPREGEVEWWVEERLARAAGVG